jgi:hypothetical protein
MKTNSYVSTAIQDIRTHLAMLNEGILSEKECLDNIYQAAEDGVFYDAMKEVNCDPTPPEPDPSEIPCDGSCTDDNGDLPGKMCGYCKAKMIGLCNIRAENGV